MFGVSATPDATPAGWYDDDADASRLRYWDGGKWSPHTAPKPADAPPAPGPEATDAAAPAGAGAAHVDDGIDDATTVRPGAPTTTSPTSGSPSPVEDTVTIVRTPPPASAALPNLSAVPPPPAAAMTDGRVDEHTTLPLPSDAESGRFSYEPYRTEGRTFVATWLFAMLLGFWGADRFYLGKIGTAVAKLLTLGGLGVWVLVDLIVVLFGAQRDREGRPLAGYDEHKHVAWIVTGSLFALGILSSVVPHLVALAMR